MLPILDIEEGIAHHYLYKNKQNGVLHDFLEFYLKKLNVLHSGGRIANFLSFIQPEIAENWIRQGNLFIDTGSPYSTVHGKYSHLLQFVLLGIKRKNDPTFLSHFIHLSDLIKYLSSPFLKINKNIGSLWFFVLDTLHDNSMIGPISINSLFLCDIALEHCENFAMAYRTHYAKKIINEWLEYNRRHWFKKSLLEIVMMLVEYKNKFPEFNVEDSRHARHIKPYGKLKSLAEEGFPGIKLRFNS
jgi:hypothetical protein